MLRCIAVMTNECKHLTVKLKTTQNSTYAYNWKKNLKKSFEIEIKKAFSIETQ